MSRSPQPSHDAGQLFRHVSAERADLYRAVMQAFAAAKRQFRLHLRPDEVRAEAPWPGGEPPELEIVQQALTQLAEWGNLTPQPDTSRVASIEDFYRARFVYRLSEGGEAVEAGMAAFVQALARRAELQTVALEDIVLRLESLRGLAAAAEPDAVKVHEVLRDLTTVFESLADNAQAFMASIARSIELQRADVAALMAYKQRLIDYLERFIADLVARSGIIAERLLELAPCAETLLVAAATREARDAAPGEDLPADTVIEEKLGRWRERWDGLNRWFLSQGHAPSQAELLRARARGAIPQLLTAIAALTERRSGKSNRAVDFRVLARWFAACESEREAHRLYRAAFALNAARHLGLSSPDLDVPASTPWIESAPIPIHPKLRERGTLAPRGAPTKVVDRSRERELLATRLAEDEAAIAAARARIVRGEPILLSELGHLDRHAFRFLLSLIGEALAVQASPDSSVERQSSDGLVRVVLEPLGKDTHAVIETDHGRFAGRDHRLTVGLVGAP